VNCCVGLKCDVVKSRIKANHFDFIDLGCNFDELSFVEHVAETIDELIKLSNFHRDGLGESSLLFCIENRHQQRGDRVFADNDLHMTV
jgi:hypothetical protein